MYGYYTQQGFRGYVQGRWILFATLDDYYEYEEDMEDD